VNVHIQLLDEGNFAVHSNGQLVERDFRVGNLQKGAEHVNYVKVSISN